MVKLDNNDLEKIKIIFRKLINKDRIGGVHVEKTQLYRWGLTEKGLKYLVNNNLFIPKKSQGEREFSVNNHQLKEIYRILNNVNDVSQL